jgi:N-formylglutamate amidohydrolase
MEKTINKFADFSFDYNSPIVCTAIHNGHLLSDNIKDNLTVKEDVRLREEDPFTERFLIECGNKIIGRTSRFEVDLNHSSEKCIYKEPEDSWGITTRKKTPSAIAISQSLAKYNEFYSNVKEHFDELQKRVGTFFVFDVHSYNHHRKGSDAEFDDPQLNPEIIIGTNNMPGKWIPLMERVTKQLRDFDYFGRTLDSRINVKFPGGHFSRWIHNNYPESACCIAIEFKKIWMDEWTSEIYEDKLQKLIEAFQSTFQIILSDLPKYK